jgi:hypothetical protein
MLGMVRYWTANLGQIGSYPIDEILSLLTIEVSDVLVATTNDSFTCLYAWRRQINSVIRSFSLFSQAIEVLT